MIRRGAPLAVALVAALAAAPARADTVTAGITDTAVTPSSLTVLAGDTVGWRNGSLVLQHTVTGNGFDSGPIQPGGGYFREFSEPGSFPYACTFHPIITGRVDVFRLLLGAPPRAVARGAATVLSGRAAAGIGGVTVEEETGTRFHAVARAQVHGDLDEPSGARRGLRSQRRRDHEASPPAGARARRPAQPRGQGVAPAQAARAVRVVDCAPRAARQALGRPLSAACGQARVGAGGPDAQRRLDAARGQSRGAGPGAVAGAADHGPGRHGYSSTGAARTLPVVASTFTS